MKGQPEILTFNRGVVSRYALARLDLKRLAVSAEQQTNWVSRAFGAMSLRPGLGYLGALYAKAVGIPFIFSASDTAVIEVSSTYLRFWVSDALVSRGTVTAAITGGNFTTSLDAAWVDEDEGAATSAWHVGDYLALNGDGDLPAAREQVVTVNEPNVAHAIRIVIVRGQATLRIGSASGGSQYKRDTTLGIGTHSIVIIPTGNFYLRLSNKAQAVTLVDSVAIEAAGTLTLPSPYAEADLAKVRYVQSGDVVFLACSGYQQRKIERRANGSWSIVLYQPPDGPFRVENTSPITITPSAIQGNIGLTASDALFDSQHVGALWTVTSNGQRVTDSIAAENTFTDPIRVFGIGESRRFSITTSGTWNATLTLQRSVGEIGSWETAYTWASVNVSDTHNDGLDNQIVYFRIGIKTGEYVSGTCAAVLNYSAGGIRGVVRLTGVTNDTTALAEVLDDLGGTDATDIWAEGTWSDYRGWPSSVEIHDGRLFWAGKDKFLGSITDVFDGYDPDYEGDAAPINRTIGFGPVDNVNWLLSLTRLIAGTATMELACRSSAFDEPLTPSNFFPKKIGTQGAAEIAPVIVDTKGVFIQAGGQSLYEVAFDATQQDYIEDELTKLCPEFLSPGVTKIAVQRKPDTRIHCVRSDGTVAILLYDKLENLVCWQEIETDGVVEDVVVLPQSVEDAVYYFVKRTIGGVAYRYLEKWALESECRGATLNKQADSFIIQTGAATVTVTGLDHLEGEEVVAWGDGVDLGTYTVASGDITLTTAAASVVVGLPYTAEWKSSKLAYVVAPGQSALGASKQVFQLGLVMADTHAQGIEFGPDFTTMDPLPLMEQGELVDPDSVHESYDESPITFPGRSEGDARLCLRATAPRPATVMAVVLHMESHS